MTIRRPTTLNRNLAAPDLLRKPIDNSVDGIFNTPLRERAFEPDIPAAPIALGDLDATGLTPGDVITVLAGPVCGAAALPTVNANDVVVDASSFTGNLSATDTDVQTALETIDAMSAGGGSALFDGVTFTFTPPGPPDMNALTINPQFFLGVTEVVVPLGMAIVTFVDWYDDKGSTWIVINESYCALTPNNHVGLTRMDTTGTYAAYYLTPYREASSPRYIVMTPAVAGTYRVRFLVGLDEYISGNIVFAVV